MSDETEMGGKDQQSLFDSKALPAGKDEPIVDLRTLEAELELRLPELRATLRDLEHAREVPQAILQLEFSV